MSDPLPSVGAQSIDKPVADLPQVGIHSSTARRLIVVDAINRKRWNRFWNPLIWVVSLLVTAVVTAVVTNVITARLSQARPLVEVSSVTIQASADKQAVLKIDNNLVSQTGAHLYYPNVEADTTVDNVTKAIDNAKRVDDLARQCCACLDKLVNMLGTQNGKRSLENRRLDFLNVWASDDDVDKTLQLAAMRVLADYEDKLPPQYQKHPPGSVGPIEVKVPTGYMILTEVNEEEVAKAERDKNPTDPNAYERRIKSAHRMNLLRRLWAYYDPDVLIPFLAVVKETLQQDIRTSLDLTGQLESVIDLASPQRVLATVVLSNAGASPMAVQTLGLVRLNVKVPNASGFQSVPVEMEGAGGAEDVIIVEGGKAATLKLQSSKTVDQIILDNPALLGGVGWKAGQAVKESRIMTLYNAEGLSADVVLARVGVGATKMKLGPTSAVQMGKEPRTTLFKSLGE